MLGIRVDPTITLGNLFAVGSVLVSLLTLLYTLRKDRTVRQRDTADRARAAASQALIALLEWREVGSHFYATLDPIFVDASNGIEESVDRQATRDSLWKAAMELRAKFLEKALEQDPAARFAGLLSYDSSTYDALARLLVQLRESEYSNFMQFMRTTQQTIFSAPLDLGAAAIGNQLRRDCEWHREAMLRDMHRLSADAEELLKAIISQSDRDLLRRAGLRAQVTKFLESEATNKQLW